MPRFRIVAEQLGAKLAGVIDDRGKAELSNLHPSHYCTSTPSARFAGPHARATVRALATPRVRPLIVSVRRPHGVEARRGVGASSPATAPRLDQPVRGAGG